MLNPITLVFLSVVKRFNKIMSLLLAAVWLPAASHALLEHFELIHVVHADHEQDAGGSHEHDADNHEAADGRCLISSAKIQISKPAATSAIHWLVAALLAGRADVESEVSHRGPSPPGVAPPEFSHRWQFSLRAALPVRAPSLAS